jgi:hypothetical protein
MQHQPEDNIRNANGNVKAGSPAKRKPPKLRKAPTSEPEADGVNKNGINGVPTSTRSKDLSSDAGSNYTEQRTDQRQNGRKSLSPEPAPQVEHQRIRHHRRNRRASRESEEPGVKQGIEPVERNNDRREQRTTKERRVSHVLNPSESQGEVGRPLNNVGEIVPTKPTEAVEQVTESVEGEPSSQKNDQLKLRLDLNLDLEVELKAKIRGDLTLQLL